MAKTLVVIEIAIFITIMAIVFFVARIIQNRSTIIPVTSPEVTQPTPVPFYPCTYKCA